MGKQFEIELNCGRKIGLSALNQSFTYEGLIEGLPTKRMNRATIKRALKDAKKLWRSDPHLIEPVETLLAQDRTWPLGTPAAIPPIICLARFMSRDPARDLSEPVLTYSTLTIVWFQSAFALPIDDEILGDIRSLGWNHLATDHKL